MAILTLILFILAVNALTYGLFGFDKHRARTGGWRIPENTLLAFSVLGGILGAKLAQRRFRHKTRKQPFAMALNAIVVFWAALLVLLLLPQTREQLLASIENAT